MLHREASNAPSDRFSIAFVLSLESSDVPRALVFTVFCWVRTKLTPNVHERRQISKLELFCPPKSSLGAFRAVLSSEKSASSSENVHPKRPRGLRNFFGRLQRAISNTKSPPAAEQRATHPPLGRLRKKKIGTFEWICINVCYC